MQADITLLWTRASGYSQQRHELTGSQMTMLHELRRRAPMIRLMASGMSTPLLPCIAARAHWPVCQTLRRGPRPRPSGDLWAERHNSAGPAISISLGLQPTALRGIRRGGPWSPVGPQLPSSVLPMRPQVILASCSECNGARRVHLVVISSRDTCSHIHAIRRTAIQVFGRKPGLASRRPGKPCINERGHSRALRGKAASMHNSQSISQNLRAARPPFGGDKSSLVRRVAVMPLDAGALRLHHLKTVWARIGTASDCEGIGGSLVQLVAMVPALMPVEISDACIRCAADIALARSIDRVGEVNCKRISTQRASLTQPGLGSGTPRRVDTADVAIEAPRDRELLATRPALNRALMVSLHVDCQLAARREHRRARTASPHEQHLPRRVLRVVIVLT